ncbi:hypothetical protein [Saccharopolyspora taberi]|uniref:Uncharacterized protein n=1 Tax=Saccharopolyspora taberi TaxID=60895 RepID=A0ABN3VAJ0_9PSEU
MHEEDQREWGTRRWPWGQRTLARITELRALLEYEWKRAEQGPCLVELKDSACAHLAKAEDAVDSSRKWWPRAGEVDCALANMNSAHTNIIRIAPVEDLRGMLPDLVALVEENLLPHDQRRSKIVRCARDWKNDAANSQRTAVVDAVRAAYRVQEREVVRVRSFARIVYGWAAGLLAISIAVAVLAALYKDAVPMCFHPLGAVVCPTLDGGFGGDLDREYHLATRPWDYVVVETAGLTAAAVTAAATLRQIRGTATAYNVPLALAVLKLPTGALTAVLGLLLMRAEFVPGLTALDTSAQIIGWAIVFGAAQQLFTRFVDERGNAVMQAVAGPESPRPPSTRRGGGQPPAQEVD